MMKKYVSLVLALCLVCLSVSVLAEAAAIPQTYDELPPLSSLKMSPSSTAPGRHSMPRTTGRCFPWRKPLPISAGQFRFS